MGVCVLEFRILFGRPATNKSEALAIISDLVTHIRALTGDPRLLVYLYFDGAPEFFTEQVLQKLQDSNIGYHKSCTGHHCQAGGAERAHQSYQATMHTLQDHAGTPSILWPYLYMLVLQLHNLKYVRSKQLVPYTALTGLKPNVTHIHIWGCLSFVHNSSVPPNKFEPRGKATIYVGTGAHDHRDSAQFLDPESGKTVFSNDYTIVASMFPFKELFRAPHAVRDCIGPLGFKTMVGWLQLFHRVRKLFGQQWFISTIQTYNISQQIWKILRSDRTAETFDASVLSTIWFGPPLPPWFFLAFDLLESPSVL